MHKIYQKVNADIDIGRVTINKGYFTLMHSLAIHNSLKLYALLHAIATPRKDINIHCIKISLI